MEAIIDIKENADKVINNIQNICSINGRSYQDITIVAASKTRDITTIRQLVDNTPIKICGENRVQEFVEKYEEDSDMDWQFIGQLQTNKVKYLIGKVSLIHSVDRIELAEKINELSHRHSIVTNILIEINMGGELTKGGVEPDEVYDFIRSIAGFENIKIMGIMSVLPNKPTEEIEPLYKKLYDIFIGLKTLPQDNLEPKYLSAGMSNDYETAIKYGSNMVRIGTGLFGARN